MTKRLQRAKAVVSSAGVKRRPKGLSRRSCGWSLERRARQSTLIRGWAPWRRSTGPKTEAGKARCAKNALRHGYRSRAYIRKFQRVRRALRLAACNILILRAFVRNAARPRIRFKLPHGARKRASRICAAYPPAPGRGSETRRFRPTRVGTRMATT